MSAIEKYLPPHLISRQETSFTEQNTPLVVAASLAGFFLSSLLTIKHKERPKLENHPMCGITTGGREECWFDCDLGTNPGRFSDLSVRNPYCLQDCGQQTHPCIASLLNDVVTLGMCRNVEGEFDGVNISDNCEIADAGFGPKFIVNGTCSLNTENLLTTKDCVQAIRETPNYIWISIVYLIFDSCRNDVYNVFEDIFNGLREECSYDCQITPIPGSIGAQVVINPACLEDCGQNTHPCFASLISDIVTHGTCRDRGFDGIQLNNSCTFDSEAAIVKGTCSSNTESLVIQPACRKAINEERFYVFNAISILIIDSCSDIVSQIYINSKRRNKIRRNEFNHYKGADAYGWVNLPELNDFTYSSNKRTRIAPAVYIDSVGNLPFRTLLKYEHTRNRYPWVCSLRSIGASTQHICAVTLLSVPPKPTVLIGAAHCTYLCKKTEQISVPSCCCASGATETCSDDKNRCGENPKVYLMTSSDANILCGEWETGNAPSSLSGEKYNLALPIKKIIRHPNFNTDEGGGPIKGNDIAIFEVEDQNIQNNRINSLRLWPSCLPLGNRTSSTGIHTGWSSPPPYHIVETYAPGYLRFFRDYFKQWHYKMNITTCQDSRVFFGVPLPSISNSSYPPGTVCGRDFSLTSCFSLGDSGSPLMVREESRPQRFYTEGIMSFVKGCDYFIFGEWRSNASWVLGQYSDNPAVYTKLSCFLPWIAKELDMDFDYTGDVEEQCVQGVGDGEGENKTCRATTLEIISTETGLLRTPECIFPFFYNGKKYEECVVITIFDWVFLPRCPIRNITKKIDGINAFDQEDAIFGVIGNTLNSESQYTTFSGYCSTNQSDPNSPLDPNLVGCADIERVDPLAQCNNDCPGVRAFGVVGGGAALAFVAGVGSLGTFGPLAGLGAIGALGMAGSRLTCTGPFFCLAKDGQCCVVTLSINGFECPDTC